MKYLTRCLLVLLILVFVAGCAKEDEPEEVSVVGIWKGVKLDGNPAEGQIIWEFTDTEILITAEGESFKGTYTIDSSTEPNRMTIKLEGQADGLAIFKLTEDSLTIKVSDAEGKGFAENFAVEDGYDLMEFQRE